ncbi:MAG TPA: O-methyltransferase [Patescibacteria group bacterium]|nr:O-methyltransferase [Patescibacteria group bacterium]
MSTRPTPVTEEISTYLNQYFSAEDDFLKSLKREAAGAKIPEICISPEQGAFLQVFLKAMGARYVLEIGSLAGYSAITMARALPEDGKLIALELRPEYAEFIRRKAAEADLGHKIEVHSGDAKEFLKDFKPEFPFDFVFIDADKRSYVEYLALTLPLVRIGGVIAGDNALAWGEVGRENPSSKEVREIQEFNKALFSHPQLQVCMVPVGDGMAMGFKKA